MNYSRYIRLRTLLQSLLRTSTEMGDRDPFNQNGRLRPLLEACIGEIPGQVQSIYSRQEGGYWPITAGDKVFVRFLNDAAKVIAGAFTKTATDRQSLRILSDRLEQILAGAEVQHNPRIRAVFFAQELYTWPSLESVYEAFVADPACEAHLVYVPFEHVNSDMSRDWLAEYRGIGLPVLPCQDYDLSAESPDLAFFVKPYDSIPKQFYIDEVDRVVSRSLYIPYGIRWVAYQELPLLVDYHFRLPLYRKAWRLINAPNDVLENHIRYGYRNGENVRLIGHPRFDSVGKLEKMRDDVPMAWKNKIRGRKVVMWNTHFSNRSGGHAESDWSTFELFAPRILSYFGQDEEIVLLWRPHPLFFGGLVTSGIMAAEDVEELKLSFETSQNMILDILADYRYAFSVADALISDASGLLPEFLLVEKPILYTCRPEKYSIVNASQLPAYYKGATWEDIETFIQMVKEGKDHKQRERMEVMRDLGMNSGKNIGELVKDHCVVSVLDEEAHSWKACQMGHGEASLSDLQ